MRNLEYEILLIKNSLSGNRTADRRAGEISNRLKHVVVKDFTELQRGEIKQIPKRVIILGGDGTVQGSLAWFMANDESPFVIVAGVGTGNIFRKSVISEGATLALKDIKDSDELARASLSFRPAVIKDEADEVKSVFIIGAGFGRFEIGYTEYRETIRQLPLPTYLKKKTSQLLAVLKTGVPSTDRQEEFFLHLYSTCPIVHGVKIFPSEALSLNSTNIGSVEIKGENPKMAIMKFIYAVSLWQLGIKPPSSIVITDVNDIFHYLPGQQGSRVTLDGEIRHLNGDTNHVIKRSDTIFPIVALV